MGVGDLLRQIGIFFCKPIYKMIPKVYAIFYNLANARFLSDDTISRVSSNLYVLISVIMLFTFSASLLSAIVNPDLINDKKKGIGAVFKRAIIGIFLIVIIPFGFDEAYKIQEKVMDNALIEKVIIGLSYSTTECSADQKDADGKCIAKGGNGGQVIAGTLISTVLYPVEDGIEVAVEGVEDAYYEMVTSDISRINDMARWTYINAAPKDSSHDYAFEFEGLLALVAGIATVYILILYAMDTAVRVFKLAFFELTAPISVVAYVASGPDIFKKWFTEVGKTFIEIFIRIGGMAMYLFLLSHLDEFTSNYSSMGLFFKLFLIIGMLIFMKQLPDITNRAFGTNWQTKGGIGGRLGSMAAVGDVAKKGWDTIKKGLTTVATAGAVGAAALSSLPALGMLGGGAALAGIGRHGWKKGFKSNGNQAWKDTKFGQKLSTAGKTAGAFLGAGNALKGLSAAGKVLDESTVGKQKETERLTNAKDQRAGDFNATANEIAKKKGLVDSKGNPIPVFDEHGHVSDKAAGKFALDTLKQMADSKKFPLSATQRASVKGLIDALEVNEYAKGALDKNDALVSDLNALAANAKTKAESTRLTNLAKQIADGKVDGKNITMDYIRDSIGNLHKDGLIGDASKDSLFATASKMVGDLMALGAADSSKNLVKSNGELALGGALKGIVNKASSELSDAESTFNTVKDASASVVAKEQMARFEGKAKDAATQNKFRVEEPGGDVAVNFADQWVQSIGGGAATAANAAQAQVNATASAQGSAPTAQVNVDTTEMMSQVQAMNANIANLQAQFDEGMQLDPNFNYSPEGVQLTQQIQTETAMLNNYINTGNTTPPASGDTGSASTSTSDNTSGGSSTSSNDNGGSSSSSGSSSDNERSRSYSDDEPIIITNAGGGDGQNVNVNVDMTDVTSAIKQASKDQVNATKQASKDITGRIDKTNEKLGTIDQSIKTSNWAEAKRDESSDK